MAEAKGIPGGWRVIIGIAVIAMGVRVILMAAMGRVDGDAVIWIFPAAEALLRGDWAGGFTPGVPPLYPGLVAVGTGLLGNVEIGARAVSVLAGVLAGIPLLWLLRRVHVATVGLAALYLLAIHPFFGRYSVIARGEVPAAVLFMASVYLGWRTLERPGLRVALLLGGLSGLGFLIRPECLALPVVAIAWLIGSRGVGTWKARGIAVLGILGPLLLVLGLHSVWVHGRTGAWTLTPKLAVNLEYGEGRDEQPPWWALTDDGEDVALFRQVGRGEYSALDVAQRALEDPLRAAGRFFGNLLRFLSYSPEWIGHVNLLLIPFGLAAFRDPLRRRQLLYCLSVVGFAVVALSFFHPARRMIVMMIPLGVILPALGLSAISHRLASREEWGVRWLGILWVAIFLATVPFLARSACKYGGWWSPMRLAGVLVKTSVVEDQRYLEMMESGRPEEPAPLTGVRVMAHPTDLAHFAGTEAVFFPWSTFDRTIRYARLHQVDYIVYEEGLARKERPEFEAAAKEGPDLEPVGEADGPVRIRIFRLK